MAKQIIIVKPKTLSPTDKAKLTKEGNLIVEHEKAAEIVFHQDTEHLPYVYTNCSYCGIRIYMLKEVISALKLNGVTFWCIYGHGQHYTKP